MIVSLIIALVIVGVALYFINLIPMDPKILLVIRVLVILMVVLYALKVLGVWNGRLP